MATMVERAPATPAAAAETRPRPRREREEEVLVWPDLVFVEFIASVLFTITLLILSTLIDSPLLDRANPDVTPNPSKAPWYLLNLQELLLHMEAGLAGVIVPTVALIGIAAIPFIDRDTEGQGEWFSTLNSVKITLFSWIFTIVITTTLILFDAGKFEPVTRWFPGLPEGQGLGGTRTLQTDWKWNVAGIDYPGDLTTIPAPLSIDNINLPGDRIVFLYWDNGQINLVAFIVEQVIPITVMVGLTILLLLILRMLRWTHSVRDVMLALFSGFMAVFLVLTIVGTAFRGEGQDLVPPWEVPVHPEGG